MIDNETSLHNDTGEVPRESLYLRAIQAAAKECMEISDATSIITIPLPRSIKDTYETLMIRRAIASDTATPLYTFDVIKKVGSFYDSIAHLDLEPIDDEKEGLYMRSQTSLSSWMSGEISDVVVERPINAGPQALYVDESLRKQGVGRLLVDTARIFFEKQGIPSIVFADVRAKTPDDPKIVFYDSLKGTYLSKGGNDPLLYLKVSTAATQENP